MVLSVLQKFPEDTEFWGLSNFFQIFMKCFLIIDSRIHNDLLKSITVSIGNWLEIEKKILV